MNLIYLYMIILDRINKGVKEIMLDFEQVRKLRFEIKLLSDNINDYENTFNVDPVKVKTFFDNYVNFIQDLQEKDEDMGIYNSLNRYHTDDNLEKYYNNLEDDALPHDKIYQYMRENNIDYSIEKYKDIKTKQFS